MRSAPGPSAPPAAVVLTAVAVVTAAVVMSAVVVITAVLVKTGVMVFDDKLELIKTEPEVAVHATLPNPGSSLKSVGKEIAEELDEPAF